MPAVQNMQNGKFYDSRSSLYRAYKDADVRIWEEGEKPEPPRDLVAKSDVYEAVQMVKQGYKPEYPEEFIPTDD